MESKATYEEIKDYVLKQSGLKVSNLYIAQVNLTMALGDNRPDHISITISTVMQDIMDDKSFDASGGIIHHSKGADLLPSNIELSGLEVRLINFMSRESVLKTCILTLRSSHIDIYLSHY